MKRLRQGTIKTPFRWRDDVPLDAVDRDRIYRRFAHAAFVRARASAVMWVAAVAALWLDILPRSSFLGITAAVGSLILLNPPTLWLLRKLGSRKGVYAWSLVIHALEIISYTAIIHFSGGIEAANLTLVYAALIAYVGVLGRRYMPFVVAALSSLAFTLMVVAEYVGWLPHQSLLSAPVIPWRTQIVITLVSVALLFVVASLASRASALLWRSRKRLRESESQFRTLADHVPGVVHLSVPGIEPRILYVGGSVEEITGRTPQDLVDNTASLLDLCHPDDRSAVGSKKDIAILDDTEYVIDYRIRDAEGNWRWVEERGQPVFDNHGKLLFLEGLILEISERKTLEREKSLRRVIQQVAQEWQLTFDTVESPVLILDSEGRIRRLNRSAQRLSGLSFDDVRGRRLSEVGPGEPWSAAEALVGEIAGSERGRSLHRATSSQSRYWQLTATLSRRFWDERIVLIMQDATRVVELEDSLRRGEKLVAIGALVGGVAHEVRNPLFGVSATLDAMRAGFGEDDELRPYLNGLRSQVNRMTDLMNGLLEYGRSAGVARHTGRLEDVIEQAITDCHTLATEVRVEIVDDVHVEGYALPMNREGLISLFGNLLSNALQHSPPGSTVTVDASAVEEGDDRWIECVVRDAGSGFGPEALTRACEPFFSRRPGGMGLGLAMVERIVEDHRGRLELSNAADGGAQVRVRLPAEPAEAESLVERTAISA